MFLTVEGEREPWSLTQGVACGAGGIDLAESGGSLLPSPPPG